MEAAELVALHRRATAAVQPVLQQVTDADLVRATPCAGWDLRALLEHMVGQDHGFAAAAAAAGVDVEVGDFAPRSLEPDLHTARSAATAALLAAFAQADPTQRVPLPELGGAFSLKAAVGFHLLDTLVHGWDVAASLGQDLPLDDELVAAALAQAQRVPTGPSRERPGAAFGPELPSNGGGDWPLTLTLVGRDPEWPRAARRGQRRQE